MRPGTGIKGGTGKWVKVGCCAELPELGVMEMVDGRWGGALPPTPASGDSGDK